MSPTTTLNLSSLAITARLKKAGLWCQSGSMFSGGFSCRQYRSRRAGPVTEVNVYFSRGHGMPDADAALLLASVVLADAGFEVAIVTPDRGVYENYLTVTKKEQS